MLLNSEQHPRQLGNLSPPPARRLCKIKYYNNCLFYNVQRNFIAQSGDPTNTGKGGESVWGVLYGEQVRWGLGWRAPAAVHLLERLSALTWAQLLLLVCLAAPSGGSGLSSAGQCRAAGRPISALACCACRLGTLRMRSGRT